MGRKSKLKANAGHKITVLERQVRRNELGERLVKERAAHPDVDPLRVSIWEQAKTSRVARMQQVRMGAVDPNDLA